MTDLSEIKEFLERVHRQNEGGNYRQNDLQGRLEDASRDGLRYLSQLQGELERIARLAKNHSEK